VCYFTNQLDKQLYFLVTLENLNVIWLIYDKQFQDFPIPFKHIFIAVVLDEDLKRQLNNFHDLNGVFFSHIFHFFSYEQDSRHNRLFIEEVIVIIFGFNICYDVILQSNQLNWVCELCVAGSFLIKRHLLKYVFLSINFVLIEQNVPAKATHHHLYL